jgi:2,4-dienoyl-CoA reductase (NADPH2)
LNPFSRLLAPLDLGVARLRNRVIMGSMHTRLEHLDRPVERLAAFYGARARGGAALIVTGGHAPDAAGRMESDAPVLDDASPLQDHRTVVDAVHAHGALACLQILHAGRYARIDEPVAPSPIRSPIGRIEPKDTIEAFARAASLARRAGYDGVEVMGSEGYLITQFTASRTNQRTDHWGGDFERRIRFPVEVVRRIREVVDEGCLVMYRISALDLVEGGLTGKEVQHLARAVESAGCNVLSTGIGWHEARVPTIAAAVPRAAWRFAVARVKAAVSLPVVASNRINTPETAESLLAEGVADLVSLARPLLADPDFVAKAAAGRAADINTCIACNQACLDRIFAGRAATCLVNPQAGHELEPPAPASARALNLGVVGAGPAGLAFAVTAAERGHRVTLYEAHDAIGGQLNLARVIPAKREFDETVRYFERRLAALGIEVVLGHEVDAAELEAAGHDHVAVAAGVRPRAAEFPGMDHPRVVSYLDVLEGRVEPGARVAIIGAGGIGFDVAEYLSERAGKADSVTAFLEEWGVDTGADAAGGLRAQARCEPAPRRQIFLLQRSPRRPGRTLGVTTGWILRERLARRGVRVLTGVTYRRVDDAGLHLAVDGIEQALEVDHVVVCAGQEPERSILEGLTERGLAATAIGGARDCAGLDALRAIEEGARLAGAL